MGWRIVNKSEIRNKFKIINSNVQNGVSDFGHSIFVLVSANFIKSGDIRISKFKVGQPSAAAKNQ